MAFNASKTIMLEKQYLYVKASKGFQLEGTNTERIWTNSGYYRFLVENVAKALSNSYVKILYDSSDIDFIAYCSDLFMEELQNTVVVAVENLQSYVEQFYDRNHEDFGAVQETLDDLNTGLSGALQVIVGKMFPPNNVDYPPSSDDYFYISKSGNYVILYRYVNGSGRACIASDFEVGKPVVVWNRFSSLTISSLFTYLKLSGGSLSDRLMVIYPDGSCYRFTSNGAAECPYFEFYPYFWVVKLE